MLKRFPNLMRISNTVARFSAEASPVKEATAPLAPKETRIQQWARFWKTLYGDYKHSAEEALSDIKAKPKKSAVYFGLIGAAMYAAATNPDERSFREVVLETTDEMTLISDAIRNPAAEQKLKFIHSCYNQGLIRHLSLGVFSFMWLENFDKDCALILDVGFLGRWWKIYNDMKDYDINPSEFSS